MDSKPPLHVTRRQFVATSAAAVAAGSLAASFAPAPPPSHQTRDSQARESVVAPSA